MLAKACVALRPVLADGRIIAERAAGLADCNLLDADEVDEAVLLGVQRIVLAELHPRGRAHQWVVNIHADEAGRRSKAQQTLRVRLGRPGA